MQTVVNNAKAAIYIKIFFCIYWFIQLFRTVNLKISCHKSPLGEKL